MTPKQKNARDYFAAQALSLHKMNYASFEEIARTAYKVADAMLIERDKK